jgi:hypothetical protein
MKFLIESRGKAVISGEWLSCQYFPRQFGCDNNGTFFTRLTKADAHGEGLPLMDYPTCPEEKLFNEITKVNEIVELKILLQIWS